MSGFDEDPQFEIVSMPDDQDNEDVQPELFATETEEYLDAQDDADKVA